MKYEEVKPKKITGLRTQQSKPSTTITKMTSVQILLHLYQRHEVLILSTALVATWTWVFVTRLG